MRGILLTAALLAGVLGPVPALADNRTLPQSLARQWAAEARTERYDGWLKNLKAFGEATEKATNRKLPPEWKHALTEGEWPWWGRGGAPDLTPRAPDPPAPFWWCIIIRNDPPAPPPNPNCAIPIPPPAP